jgi:hypothetical protein
MLETKNIINLPPPNDKSKSTFLAFDRTSGESGFSAVWGRVYTNFYYGSNIVGKTHPYPTTNPNLHFWHSIENQVNLDSRLCGGGFIQIFIMDQILLVKPAPTGYWVGFTSHLCRK